MSEIFFENARVSLLREMVDSKNSESKSGEIPSSVLAYPQFMKGFCEAGERIREGSVPSKLFKRQVSHIIIKS